MPYTPTRLRRWTRPDCYAGPDWLDYYSSGVGRSRDSDDLEESNFHAMLKSLGGEKKTVFVVRESHWAVGWVEWIAIHKRNTRALKIADENRQALDDYPVLDEGDWCEREHESASVLWRDCYNVEERIAYIRQHENEFEFSNYADMLGCVRGRYFAGYASELVSR